MNNAISMWHKGNPYTFDEIKWLDIPAVEPYKKYTKEWNDHYIGLLKCHPLKLYGIISKILTENEQIKGIIEIGTFMGALSCYLGAECVERGYKSLLTFDNKVWYTPKLFKNLNINFILDDCFSEKSLQIIKEYVKDTPVMFICDGGWKSKEFNTFAPLLPDGSVIGVHDWDVEVNMEGIGETVNSLEMFFIKQEQWSAEPHYLLMAWCGIPERGNK